MKIRVTDVVVRAKGMSLEFTDASNVELEVLRNPSGEGSTLSVNVLRGDAEFAPVSVGSPSKEISEMFEKMRKERAKRGFSDSLQAAVCVGRPGQSSEEIRREVEELGAENFVTGDCAGGVRVAGLTVDSPRFKERIFFKGKEHMTRELLEEHIRHTMNDPRRLVEEFVCIEGEMNVWKMTAADFLAEQGKRREAEQRSLPF